MSFLLDSNVCVTLLRAKSKAGSVSIGAAKIRARLESNDAAGRESFVCSVVRLELLAGAARSERVQENLSRAQTLLSAFRSLPFDDAAADHAARSRAALEASGTPIGPNDLLIAAIALANGLTLVTHNTAEFARVPGLRVEDWEALPPA